MNVIGTKPSATELTTSTGSESSEIAVAKEGDSFKEAHEYGLGRARPVAVGYEEIDIDVEELLELPKSTPSYAKIHRPSTYRVP
jgi:hypothetical protein